MDIVRRIEVAKESGNFLSLQDELFALNIQTQSRLILVAILRYTYATRTHYPRWDELRDAIKAELIRRGDPWERMLRGLFPVDKN